MPEKDHQLPPDRDRETLLDHAEAAAQTADPGLAALLRNRFVDDRVAATYLGLSRSYLRQLRVKGGGPAYSKFGKAIRYSCSALADYASRRSVASTSATAELAGK